MADENENAATRKPPVSPRPKESGDNPDVRPVKKKKKKKPSDTQEGTDTVEGGDPKPRRRRSKSASRDTEGETESAPVTPKKKKRKPKLSHDADEDKENTDRTTEQPEVTIVFSFIQKNNNNILIKSVIQDIIIIKAASDMISTW